MVPRAGGSTYLRVVRSVSDGGVTGNARRHGLTILVLDALIHHQVHGQDDDIAGQVQGAAAVKPEWVFEGYPLRYLHHNHDDGQVDAVVS